MRFFEKKTQPPKPRYCQKLENPFSITFQLEYWIGKSNHQNQDNAKSSKKQFFNCSSIIIWISKKQPPKPRYCQKLEKTIFQLVINWNINRKKQPPKPRYCQKLEKSIFQLLFNYSFVLEKATTKTKILPKTIEDQFFNYFLIKIVIRKSNH